MFKSTGLHKCEFEADNWPNLDHTSRETIAGGSSLCWQLMAIRDALDYHRPIESTPCVVSRRATARNNRNPDTAGHYCRRLDSTMPSQGHVSCRCSVSFLLSFSPILTTCPETVSPSLALSLHSVCLLS
jgi:hypothetical protein